MCGLVAAFTFEKSRFSKDDIDAFKLSLRYDIVRGKDSTGVFLGNVDDNEIFVAKGAGDANKFLSTKESDELFSEAWLRADFLVGHNRAATRGAVNDDNAHPFTEGPIALVHNGTLRGGHKHLANTEVDSHAICHLLAANEDPNEALKQIDGAYVLIWFDQRNKTLNFVRNHERPLWMMKDKARNTFYLSSEPYIMAAACWHNDIKVTDNKEVEAYKLHTVDLSTQEVRIALREVERYTPTKKSYQDTSPAYWNGYRMGFGYGVNDYDDGVPFTPTKVSESVSQQESTTKNKPSHAEIANLMNSISTDYPSGAHIIVKVGGLEQNVRFDQPVQYPWTLEGKIYRDEGLKAIVVCTEADVDDMNMTFYCKAEVVSVRNDVLLGIIIIARFLETYDMEPELDIKESRNGKKVSYDMYLLNIPECHDCGVELQFREIPESKVILTSDGKRIKTCICKDCCEEKKQKALEAATTQGNVTTLH